MYHIKKRGQALQYIKYTQHESIYRRDVMLPLHIGNRYQQILKENSDTNLKQILKLVVVNKTIYDTNEITLSQRIFLSLFS